MNRADDLQFDSSVLYCITATESDLHSATDFISLMNAVGIFSHLDVPTL